MLRAAGAAPFPASRNNMHVMHALLRRGWSSTPACALLCAGRTGAHARSCGTFGLGAELLASLSMANMRVAVLGICLLAGRTCGVVERLALLWAGFDARPTRRPTSRVFQFLLWSCRFFRQRAPWATFQGPSGVPVCTTGCRCNGYTHSCCDQWRFPLMFTFLR